MDSTRAIIRLWRICSPSDVGPQVGGDGALHVDLLKAVLDRELQDKMAFLDGRSVDDILWKYMLPDGGGVVGFLHFWRGMEQILQACGAHRNCLGTWQTHAIDGFRFLRECVLEMAPSDTSQGRSVFRVSELRYFIERTTHVAGPEGAMYWQHQADLLPEDHIFVTGEEVSSALLAWLEDLVEPDDDDVIGGDDSTDEGNEDNIGDSADEGTIPLPEHDNEPCDEDEGYEHNEFSSRGLRLPVPTQHMGMPQDRNRLIGTAVDGRGGVIVGARGYSSSVASDRVVSPLESSLTAHLERYERRPPSPTKVQASEWRDSAEFHVALKMWIGKVQANCEELTLSAFHRFTRDHVRKVRRRTNERSVSPRMRSLCSPKGVQVLLTSLNGLRVRRIQAGWSALLAARREQPTSFPRAEPQRSSIAGPGDFDILDELLKAQCQTALVLEQRVKVAGRMGTLAFAIARLLRKSYRSAWEQLEQLVEDQPEPRPAPPSMPWMRPQQTRGRDDR